MRVAMSIDLDIAAGYRQHAEELRVVAADASSAAIRAIWLVLAADYEHVADSLEGHRSVQPCDRGSIVQGGGAGGGRRQSPAVFRHKQDLLPEPSPGAPGRDDSYNARDSGTNPLPVRLSLP